MIGNSICWSPPRVCTLRRPFWSFSNRAATEARGVHNVDTLLIAPAAFPRLIAGHPSGDQPSMLTIPQNGAGL